MRGCRQPELWKLAQSSRSCRSVCLIFNNNCLLLRQSSNVRRLHVGKVQRRIAPNPAANHVVVLGGGITGLATAFFLTQELPKSRVTILEKSGRLGGWLESPIHEIGGSNGGHVVFENGPRTLRQDIWGGHSTRELVQMLGLAEELVVTPKSAPAARNRFIYYPDHLVRMPAPIPGVGIIGNIWQNVRNIQREPVFDGLVEGIAAEVLSKRPEKADGEDESVGDFLSRRFPKSVAENIVSAVLHGIYAGNVYRLSARSLLPLFHFHDQTATHKSSYSSIFDFQLKMWVLGVKVYRRRLIELVMATWDGKTKFDEYVRGNLPSLESASVFTFKKGLQQLVERLESRLKANPKVTIKLNANIDTMGHDRNSNSITIAGRGPSGQHFKVRPDYVVSTLPAPIMHQLLPEGTSAGFDGYRYTVNVMVVNLFYRSPTLIPFQGFGYLIPRSISFEQNPECTLGVIFGSDSSVGQDTAEGTKLTVMMGGHWWDGLPVTSLPDSQSAIQMARNVLSRHLGVTAEPLLSSAKLQLSAIPQYTVGHSARLEQIHNSLTQGPFQGKIKVAGSWYTGVGVNDCIAAARQAAINIREGHDDQSGLEDFINPRWLVERKGCAVMPDEQEQLLGIRLP